LGDVAEVRKVKRDGPATDIYYDKNMKQYVPVTDPGVIIQDKIKRADQPNRSVDSRVAAAESRSDEYKRDLARQSEFDLSKEKQRTAASAAQRYRDTADNVDPFRRSVFG
jgi:hypothetical protein